MRVGTTGRAEKGSLGRQPGGFGLAQGPGEMELPSVLELGLPGHQGVGLVRAGLGAFWGAFRGTFWGGPGEGLELPHSAPSALTQGKALFRGQAGEPWGASWSNPRSWATLGPPCLPSAWPGLPSCTQPMSLSFKGGPNAPSSKKPPLIQPWWTWCACGPHFLSCHSQAPRARTSGCPRTRGCLRTSGCAGLVGVQV